MFRVFICDKMNLSIRETDAGRSMGPGKGGTLLLKTVLYYLVLITTGVKLADVIYLLAQNESNLPAAVFVAASFAVVYGIFLVFKRMISSVRLGQLMGFYIFYTLVIVFNLIYVAVGVPVKITLLEMVVVGTFLEILINITLISLCIRHRRGRFITVGGM